MSAQHQSWPRHRVVRAFGALMLFVLLMANWLYPVLRLSHPLANQLLFGLSLLLPVVAFREALYIPSGSRRTGAMLGLLPVLLLSSLLLLPVAMCSAITISEGGVDPSYVPVRSHSLGASQVRAFRTNGGATTSFGIVLVHELRLLPGLLLVRPLGGMYPAYDAELQLAAPNILEARFHPYGESRPTSDSIRYPLKRYVYW
jgi:hypothetical protein